MKGVYILETLLARCAEVLTVHTHRDDHVFVITTCLVHVFALLLQDREFVNNGDLYHNMGFMPKEPGLNYLVRNIVGCLKFTQRPVLVRHAVSCVSALCQRPELQQEMMLQGTLYLLCVAPTVSVVNASRLSRPFDARVRVAPPVKPPVRAGCRSCSGSRTSRATTRTSTKTTRTSSTTRWTARAATTRVSCHSASPLSFYMDIPY